MHNQRLIKNLYFAGLSIVLKFLAHPVLSAIFAFFFIIGALNHYLLIEKEKEETK